MALGRILLHLEPSPGSASPDPDGARPVRRAIDPADVYAQEADGGDTLPSVARERREALLAPSVG